jgi:purine-nucleoside phosphorylase
MAVLMNTHSPQPAASKLRSLSPLRPRLAIVLGTGFDLAVDEFEKPTRVPYAKMPGFPDVGVPGHRGELAIGRWEGTPVIVLRGRAHFYEGHPLSSVTFPVRALAAYGVRDLLLTNAAGAINPNLRVGDLMVFRDHLNFMGANPLRGTAFPELSRFVDLTSTYDPTLRRLLRRAGRASGLNLRPGIYLAVSGPSYETPAEIRAFRRLGADAVGMSTVPEAIVARQCGLRVAAVSCITNLAAGLSKTPLSHADVLKSASVVKHKVRKMLAHFMLFYAEIAP